MTPFLFQRKQRIVRKKDFDAIYSSGNRCTVGPLLILSKPNNVKQTRLGLSVPKRVGNAVIRNLIKRKCREAFRISQHRLPKETDILITARPHTPLSTETYVDLIEQGVSGD
ncbi:MAG: ribonuclease P protein component [Phycisphaerales bacterium]|jgi:ribonuclease P protein component|nr:ribonuclease P protein component [Phycisphaerales bacterium]